MTLDELQANYRRERQGLEEQSDDLRRAQSHGEQRKINHKIEDLEQTYRSEYQKRSNEKR